MNPHLRRPHGFTLVELAIVLVIVALLTGGMLLSLSAQSDARNAADARKQLNEIKDALLGFAATNGYLPCPDDDTDPTSASYGVAETGCTNKEGWLPFKTLGVYEFDPWGTHRTQNSDPPLGRWRYRVDTAFTGAIKLTTVQTDALSIVDNRDSPLTNTAVAQDRPVVVFYSTGANGAKDGFNATADPIPPSPLSGKYQSDNPGNGFDDILGWISRPILFNRLIAAGRSL